MSMQQKRMSHKIHMCVVRFTEKWKPIDPEEKKRYDREFLLGCQFINASMHKPEGLPSISDVVLDKVGDILFHFAAECDNDVCHVA